MSNLFLVVIWAYSFLMYHLSLSISLILNTKVINYTVYSKESQTKDFCATFPLLSFEDFPLMEGKFTV